MLYSFENQDNYLFLYSLLIRNELNCIKIMQTITKYVLSTWYVKELFAYQVD